MHETGNYPPHSVEAYLNRMSTKELEQLVWDYLHHNLLHLDRRTFIIALDILSTRKAPKDKMDILIESRKR